MIEITDVSTAAGTAERQGECGCGGCGCGANQEVEETPQAQRAAGESADLDVTTIPHAVRHATVIEHVAALVPGEALVIAAPHHPARLLDQIVAEVPGCVSFEALAEGPEVWRVQVTRDTCC